MSKKIKLKKDGTPDGRSRPKTAKHLAVHRSPRAPRRGQGAQFQNNNAETWTEQRAIKLGNELIAWISEKVDCDLHKGTLIPDIECNIFISKFLNSEKGLGGYIIDRLSNRFESFAVLYKKAKEIQEEKIARLAAVGYLNPAMAIFSLKHHHGWRDKIEHQVTENKTLTIDIKLEKALDKCGDNEIRKMLVAEIPDEEEVVDA